MQHVIDKAKRMSQSSDTTNQKRKGTGTDKMTKTGPIQVYKPKPGTDVRPTTVGGKPYEGKLYSKKPQPSPKFRGK